LCCFSFLMFQEFSFYHSFLSKELSLTIPFGLAYCQFRDTHTPFPCRHPPSTGMLGFGTIRIYCCYCYDHADMICMRAVFCIIGTLPFLCYFFVFSRGSKGFVCVCVCVCVLVQIETRASYLLGKPSTTERTVSTVKDFLKS
jgi:hypothetical protein